MNKKKRAHNIKNCILMLLFFCLSIASLPAQEETPDIQQSVFLLTFQQITLDKDYEWLADNIYNAFEINLKKEKSISLITGTGDEAFQRSNDTRTILQVLKTRYNVQTCIRGEYYIAGGELHIMVRVIDMYTLRDKNCFVESMPADLDMLPRINSMSEHISRIVAKTLPVLSREALVQKKIAVRLQEKLDNEEKILAALLNKHHELILSPFTGIHLGRSVISWILNRPLFALPLSIEYSFIPTSSFHIKAGIEYLPFNLMAPHIERTEVGGQILFGIQTAALFSFHFDTGIGITYNNNTASTALSDFDEDGNPVYPDKPVERISLSIPIQAGISLYMNKSFFMNFRITNYGLTYTIENEKLENYERGNIALKYDNGFSLLNFISLSLSIHGGIRF
jgi:TolB-like protein